MTDPTEPLPNGQFWQDLRRDLEDPEFRRVYVAFSREIADQDEAAAAHTAGARSERWRPGRKVGRTLYIHRDGQEDGELVGVVDTRQLASAICDAMNNRGQPEPAPSHVQDVGDTACEMRGEDVPQPVLEAAQCGYSMHGAGLVANLIAAAWPSIARRVLRCAAEALLAEDVHDDSCALGPLCQGHACPNCDGIDLATCLTHSDLDEQPGEAAASSAATGSNRQQRADTWTVAVQIPITLPAEMRDSLSAAIADAVAAWAPEERDGWDAIVSGYPAAHDHTSLATRKDLFQVRAEKAEATVQRSREALAAFDGCGVNNFDVPTPAEVLEAWRASLASNHKETQ